MQIRDKTKKYSKNNIYLNTKMFQNLQKKKKKYLENIKKIIKLSKGRRIRKKSHSIFRVSIPVPIFMEIFTHLYISFISLYFRTVRDIIHSVLKQGHISHAAWRTGKRERVQPGKVLWNQFCQTSRFAS